MRYILGITVFICLWFIGMTSAASQSVATYIPPRAEQYLPTLYEEVHNHLPGFKYPNYFGSLVEHESCISLTHSRCWSPTSELKTSREQGVGFGQITRAWDSTGKLRFDTLSNLTSKFKLELEGLNWLTIKDRPDLQLRAMVLLWRDDYNRLSSVKGPINRIRMADAAYNGGLASVNTARTKCGLSKDCNPQWWFDNVEKFQKLNQTKPIYAGRSARDINLHHVKDVTVTRWKKYEDHYLNWKQSQSKDQ